MFMRSKCNAHRANVFGKFMIYDAQSLSICNEGTPTGESSAFYKWLNTPSISVQGFIASCPPSVRGSVKPRLPFVGCLSDTSLVLDELYLFLLLRTTEMT
jgi:hypothetical protein